MFCRLGTPVVRTIAGPSVVARASRVATPNNPMTKLRFRKPLMMNCRCSASASVCIETRLPGMLTAMPVTALRAAGHPHCVAPCSRLKTMRQRECAFVQLQFEIREEIISICKLLRPAATRYSTRKWVLPQSWLAICSSCLRPTAGHRQTCCARMFAFTTQASGRPGA